MQTPNYKISAKVGGSVFDKTNPIVKCEWIFNETNDPKYIFEAVIHQITKNNLTLIVYEMQQKNEMG
jgi:hypothetical protein